MTPWGSSKNSLTTPWGYNRGFTVLASFIKIFFFDCSSRDVHRTADAIRVFFCILFYTYFVSSRGLVCEMQKKLTNQEFETRLFLWYKTLLAL